ncbi:hypothetical protein D9M71_423350 [compost metagenome]
MRAGLDLLAGDGLADHRRADRFHRHREDRLALGVLDIAGNPGDGAAGTDPGDQHVHRAVGVVPDFRAGGLLVDGRVGRVVELLRHEVFGRIAGDDFLGPGDRALHALGRLGEHQFGAEGLEHLAPLQAHGCGHGEDQLVATRRGDEGQADAGIARGRLDNGHARLEPAAAFRVPDHVRADPAFDRITRVTPFGLGQNGHAARGDAVDLHQRRIADGMRVVSKDTAHGGVLLCTRRKTSRVSLQRQCVHNRRTPATDRGQPITTLPETAADETPLPLALVGAFRHRPVAAGPAPDLAGAGAQLPQR